MGMLIKILCVIFLPPLGVLFHVGMNRHFWINIILTLFGILPGTIHGIWVLATERSS